MAQIKIDFDWQRDTKGYRLVDAQPPVARRPVKIAPSLLNPGGTLGGPMFGGITLPARLLSAETNRGNPQRVVRRGGALKSYRPFDVFGSLFQIFAKTARTPDGVLGFIEKFGPLTREGLDVHGGESVQFVIGHAKAMHDLLTHHAAGQKLSVSHLGAQKIQLTQIHVALVGDRVTERLNLQLSVDSLIAALWLQLGQALSGGANIEQCLHCGDLFETGPGKGRRLDAKFCSDEHRVAFNSIKRSKEK